MPGQPQSRVGIAFVLLVAALLALAPAAEAGKGKKRKPDLKVQRVDNQDFLLTPDRLELKYTVRNVGRKRAEGADIAIKFFKRNGLATTRAFTEKFDRIGNIAPDETFSDLVRIEVPLGRYVPEVCVKLGLDKRKGNNCKRGAEFAVVPTSWQGSVTSTAPLSNRANSEATQNSSAQAGTGFFFEGNGDEEIRYAASGMVRFYVEGTDPDGCKWSGSKTVSASSADKLILDEDLLGYRFVPGTFATSYPVTAACPQPLGNVETTLISGPWLPGFPQFRSDSAETTLSGTVPAIPGFPGDFAWSLSAK